MPGLTFTEYNADFHGDIIKALDKIRQEYEEEAEQFKERVLSRVNNSSYLSELFWGHMSRKDKIEIEFENLIGTDYYPDFPIEKTIGLKNEFNVEPQWNVIKEWNNDFAHLLSIERKIRLLRDTPATSSTINEKELKALDSAI